MLLKDKEKIVFFILQMSLFLTFTGSWLKIQTFKTENEAVIKYKKRLYMLK